MTQTHRFVNLQKLPKDLNRINFYTISVMLTNSNKRGILFTNQESVQRQLLQNITKINRINNMQIMALIQIKHWIGIRYGYT